MSNAPVFLSVNLSVAPGGRGAYDQSGTFFGPSTQSITSLAVALLADNNYAYNVAGEIEFDAFDVTALTYQQYAALQSGDLSIGVAFTTHTSDPFDRHTIDVASQTEAGIDLQPEVLADTNIVLAYDSGGSDYWFDYQPVNFFGLSNSSGQSYPGVPVQAGVGGENNGVQQSDDATYAVLTAYANNSDVIFSFGETSGGASNVDNVFLAGEGFARGIPVVKGVTVDVTTDVNTPIMPFAGAAIYDDATSPMETVTITTLGAVIDAPGTATDANGLLSGAGLLKTAVGTYQLTGTPQDVTTALASLTFTPAIEQLPGRQSLDTNITISVHGTEGTGTGGDVIVVTPATSTHINAIAVSTTDDKAVPAFGAYAITDPGSGTTYAVTLTAVDTATGSTTDANGTLSGEWLTKTDVGIYTLSGPVMYEGGPGFTDLTSSTLDQELAALTFTPTDHQMTPGTTVQTSIRLTAVSVYGKTSTAVASSVTALAAPTPPTISGTHSSVAAPGQGETAPFTGVTVADPDFGDTETVTISYPSKQGVLSGVGLNAQSPGVYELSGSPETVTAQLDAVQFVPTVSVGSSPQTRFQLQAASSGGPRTEDFASRVTQSPSPACYTRGTKILTAAGEVAVESLAIGDRLVTASGRLRPIVWIGRRSYSGRFLASNPGVHPIRFRAGALGTGLPRRDLCVSPRHAMFVDGVLVPAACLVNGATIVQAREQMRVDYLHVELDSHDVILAEGAPSETFLDDDSRGMFHNAADYAARYPGRRAARRFCAPRVESGPLLDAIRSRLDGAGVRAMRLEGEGAHVFAIDRGTCAVRLVTRNGHMPVDRRRLGCAVSGISLDGVEVPLGDPRLVAGWHGCEGGWRWTDGAALVLVADATKLAVTVVASPFATAA